jgi:pseudaminic acid synthase
MQSHIEIAGRKIGPGYPTFIIAEISANHNQSFEEAVALVRAAKEIGVDAVKLQTYTADTLTIASDKPWFRIEGLIWEGKNLHDLYGEAYTPWDWQPKLKRLADELGLILFSSPFDDSAVDFLETMNVPAYKVASFELVDTGLLQRIARTKKPVIMSTGMATLEEIDQAVTTLRDGGIKELALLKCTSAYPAPYEEVNLRTIPHLSQAFGVPAGLSDHTLGITIPVAAVALGATIIEKHFTRSRSVPGPDSAFSLEPDEVRDLVTAVRNADAALGAVHYGVTEREAKSRGYRRSLFVVKDIKSGEPLTRENVRSIRPGNGLAPRFLSDVIGRRASRDVERGTPLTWDLVS